MSVMWREMMWAAGLEICAVTALALDTRWTNELQTLIFYEGDAYGTVCHDVYIDGANPTVNYNGVGLNLRWFISDQRPGYIRFDNWLNRIPAGSFIYKADLLLTASAGSTGSGNVIMGARGAATFDEATVTWNTMPTYYAQAPGAYWYNHNNLWKRAFGTNLAAGTSVTCNISSAVRAWFDYYQNPGWGYTNAGVWMNTDAGGSAHAENSESFYDSENGTAANRPRLVVQFLPWTSTYRMYIYQAAATDTAQIMKVTAEDAFIAACNYNAQQFGCTNDNFGKVYGPQQVWELDGYISGSGLDLAGVYPKEFFRWRALSYPPHVQRYVADVKLRVNTGVGWNDGETGPISVRVQKILKNWVEGTGVSLGKPNFASPPLTTSQTNVTWCNYDAVPGDTTLTTNAWQAHGASGSTDSTNLYIFTMGDQYGETLSSDANGLLLGLVQDWLDGVGPNNGLALTVASGGYSSVQIGNAETGVQPYRLTDSYLTAGLLVVFKRPIGTVFCVH